MSAEPLLEDAPLGTNVVRVAGSQPAPDTLLNTERYYVMVPHHSNALLSSAVDVLDAYESSPWWQARIINSPPLPLPSPKPSPDRSARSIFHVLRFRREAATPDDSLSLLEAEHELRPQAVFALDFGSGVIPSTPSGALIHSIDPSWADAPRFGLWGDQEVLTPDTPEAIAAAEPAVDDTEWDDGADGPRWISLDDLPYRGGGIMGRRRAAEDA